MIQVGRGSSMLASLARTGKGRFGLAIVIVFVLSGLTAPWVAPGSPSAMDSEAQLQPPSGAHWLGTDNLGRDIFSRLLHGSRISLTVAVISVSIAAVIGVPLGLLSGYFGAWVDGLLMRVIDLMLAFPSILLAITIMAALGPSIYNVMIAVGIVNIPTYARQVRASVLALKNEDFITASRACGASHWRIMLRGVLPNIASPVIVLATLGTGTALLEAAGLSFLGLGGEPGLPEWGNMLTTTRQYIRSCPWVSLSPGLAISLTVLGFNFLGDALRDCLDPKLAREIR